MSTNLPNNFLTHFAQTYNHIDAQNLSLLDEIYSADIEFSDPLYRIYGLPALKSYFAQMYANISQIQFEFEGMSEITPAAPNGAHQNAKFADEREGYLRWRMCFVHPKLNTGQAITVLGCTHLKWQHTNQQVFWHRDYFDAGQMLYEHVPILKHMIAWLKGRLT